MKFARLALLQLAVVSTCVALAQSPGKSILNDPNIIVPDSSIEHPGDRGHRFHTNVLIYAGPGSGGYLAPPLMALSQPRGPLALSYGPPFTPADLQNAYLGGTTASAGAGAIAIVDAFDYSAALNDFNTFSSQFSLPQETSANPTASTNNVLQVVYASGTRPAANNGWELEEALDMEWAHAMAPGAKIYLVEAASDANSDLLAAVDVAKTLLGVKEISMSWGGSEYESSTYGYETNDDSHFTGAFGFFAAAGDSGGQVIYPSASPNVISCGGTHLVLNSTGGYSSESVWSGSGGGPSAYEAIPTYQSSISSIVGSARGTPDIAADADPNTGVYVYSSLYDNEIGWWEVGGTSLATPVCAGIANAGGSNEISSNQSEQTFIYSQPAAFHDVVSGSAGSYSATAGWDFCTGWGSPITAGSLNGTTAIASVTIKTTPIIGGNSDSATVTLQNAAPAGGATVSLSTDSADVTSLPTTLTIAGGSTNASVSFGTTGVASQVTAHIQATLGASSQIGAVVINPASVSSFKLSASSVVGGSSTVVTGTITLNGQAPAGGATVSLGSSNTSAASVPASTSIGAGSNTGNFTVTTSQVPSTQSATITVTLGSPLMGTLSVTPFTLSSFSANPTTIVGGKTSSGKVTLNATVGPTPVVVTLQSNFAAATVPATVNVTTGQSSGSFTISTTTVNSTASGTMTGTLNSTTKTVNLSVTPPAVSKLGISPGTVNGSSTTVVTGTITLSGPAPSGNSTVTLSSSNPSACSVPASATVLAGNTTVTFTLTQYPVGGSTPVTVTATYNGTQKATETVTPAPVYSVNLLPSSVTGGSPTTVTATVKLNGVAAPGGAVVSLSSSNTAVATVPSTVTVPAGMASATFPVTTYLVATTQSVKINATYAGTKTGNLTVNPYSLSAFTISPTTVSGSSSTVVKGTVTLNTAAPAAGITVMLLSSNTGAAQVPASVVVLAGATQATFTVSQQPVSASTPVTISATVSNTKTVNMTITP